MVAKYAVAMEAKVTAFSDHAKEKHEWGNSHKVEVKDKHEIASNNKKFNLVVLCSRDFDSEDLTKLEVLLKPDSTIAVLSLPNKSKKIAVSFF